MTRPKEATNPCRKCGSTDIAPSRVARRDWVCRACENSARDHGKYDRSSYGVARRLRAFHNLSEAESEYWAVVLLHAESRCDICGVPNHRLKRMGVHKAGGGRCNQRLTLDHVTPGINDGNYRPLCFSCNAIRGAAKFTDAEVLAEMRGWYRALFSLRKLYWLNTHYDLQHQKCVGGRPYQTERMRQKFADIREGGDD